MSLWQELAKFEQREQFYVEAAAENAAASALLANQATIESFLDTEAPQGVDALVAAIEKADAKIPEGVFINTVINANKATVEADLQAAINEGGALIPSAVKVLQTNAAALQAKAAAL